MVNFCLCTLDQNHIAERFFYARVRCRSTRQMSFNCFSSNQDVVDQSVDHGFLKGLKALIELVFETDAVFLKSAAYPRGGVPVRFRSRAPVSLRLFRPSNSEKAFFPAYSVAQSLHKESNQHAIQWRLVIKI